MGFTLTDGLQDNVVFRKRDTDSEVVMLASVMICLITQMDLLGFTCVS